LSIGKYKEQVLKRGPQDIAAESLEGTPWEDAWHNA
jgi:hypothetical protein